MDPYDLHTDPYDFPGYTQLLLTILWGRLTSPKHYSLRFCGNLKSFSYNNIARLPYTGLDNPYGFHQDPQNHLISP